MSDYIPPFNISNEMLECISNIMEKVGKLNNFDIHSNISLEIGRAHV